ncbi:unnamed protein product, partial [Iphiclides podalirius]
MERLSPEVSTEGAVPQDGQIGGVAGKVLGLLPVFILILIIILRIVFVLYKNTAASKSDPNGVVGSVPASCARGCGFDPNTGKYCVMNIVF